VTQTLAVQLQNNALAQTIQQVQVGATAHGCMGAGGDCSDSLQAAVLVYKEQSQCCWGQVRHIPQHISVIIIKPQPILSHCCVPCTLSRPSS
jgi:hypothetical protein